MRPLGEINKKSQHWRVQLPAAALVPWSWDSGYTCTLQPQSFVNSDLTVHQPRHSTTHYSLSKFSLISSHLFFSSREFSSVHILVSTTAAAFLLILLIMIVHVPVPPTCRVFQLCHRTTSSAECQLSLRHRFHAHLVAPIIAVFSLTLVLFLCLYLQLHVYIGQGVVHYRNARLPDNRVSSHIHVNLCVLVNPIGDSWLI